MADKYIRHGETYNGDGTTSAAAASNGGVGAWNTITYFEGTTPAYGTLAAGDRVFIRSKDAGSADITRTVVLSATTFLGSTAATEASPIHWVIDTGTIWSGISGVVTYQSNCRYSLHFRENNYIEAESHGALHVETTSFSNFQPMCFIGGYVKRLKVTRSHNGGPSLEFRTNYGGGPVSNGAVTPTLESPRITSSYNFAGTPVFHFDGPSNALVIDADTEITGTSANQLFARGGPGYANTQGTFIGGRIRGAGASSMTTLFASSESSGPASSGAELKILGMDVPRGMPVMTASPLAGGRVEMVGLDGGIGSHFEESWGWATSRTDNNPPVLSGQLPDSTGTYWAWRVFPRAASFAKPAKLKSAKMFTGAAATKTITTEFLVSTTLAPTKRNVWMTVQYMDDATGEMRHLTTQDMGGAALDTSTASWSITTWGLASFNKRKCAITTPTTIRQNSLITVTWWCALLAVTVNQDIYFLDQDFGVT